MNIKKDFKSRNTTNSHNILTDHTFDFHNSAKFAFIHDKDQCRIIEAYFIKYFEAIIQRQSFYKISPSLAKIILKDFNVHLQHSPFFLDIQNCKPMKFILKQ